VAYNKGELKKMHIIQQNLMNSYGGKAKAVWETTLPSKGHKTPGGK
jgi:hypothetical protein